MRDDDAFVGERPSGWHSARASVHPWTRIRCGDRAFGARRIIATRTATAIHGLSFHNSRFGRAFPRHKRATITRSPAGTAPMPAWGRAGDNPAFGGHFAGCTALLRATGSIRGSRCASGHGDNEQACLTGGW